MRWRYVVLGLALLALALAWRQYPVTSATQAAGTVAVDCNASAAGTQSNCAYPLGATFRVYVVPAKPPAGGYFAFQVKVRWNASQLDYQPAAAPADEVLWPHCTIPARIINEPDDSSVLFGCTPLPWLNEGDTSTSPLLQLDFTCQSGGYGSLELVPLAGDAQLGTHYVDQNVQPVAPALANASVLCGPTPTATPCPSGGCPTATRTATPTPPLSTPTRRPTSTPQATPTPTEVLGPGDLAISKSDSPDPVVTGASLTYTVVVSNIGGQPLGVDTDPQDDRIEVRDQPPPNFTYTSFSSTLNGACQILSAAGSPLICRYDRIRGGESAVITVTGRIAATSDIIAHNEVWVDLPISHIDEAIEVSNNYASADTTVLLTAPTPCPPDACPPTPTATATATPTATHTPTSQPTATATASSSSLDSDGDGCTDSQELGPDPLQGGRRDPASFWDFMDVPTGASLERDVVVSAADVAAVIARFGSTDAGPGDFDRDSDPRSTPNAATVPPGARTNYHSVFDRGGVIPGQPVWWLRPADGSITTGDLAAVTAQFGHSCA